MSFPEQLGAFAQLVAGGITPFLIAVAAIGVLSMAIIQTFKDLLPLRREFQARYLRGWLRGRALRAAEAIDPVLAERDLVRLAAAGDGRAFYGLPVEQLCGQLAAAATVMLDFPGAHRDLLACLAAEADPDDRSALLRAAGLGRVALDRLRTDAPDEFQKMVDARSRVTHQVQRSIDTLQIAAGSRWKLVLQGVAFALSYGLAIAGTSLFAAAEAGLFRTLLVALPPGLAAGFLAPVARDVLAIVGRARRA